LITGIGALVLLYASRYLEGDPWLSRLVLLLILFMIAMLGSVTADDVITLFVFWELTSLASFFLVGYDHEKSSARKAALQALLVTGSGGLAFLAGLVLVSIAADTTSLSGIITAREAVLAHPLAMPAMLLIVLGCFTQSAQFPFHFWLPGAMAGPSQVSAFLHSATMVKAGVYFLVKKKLYSCVLFFRSRSNIRNFIITRNVLYCLYHDFRCLFVCVIGDNCSLTFKIYLSILNTFQFC
jgi:multicomponent Na+:H+ antiporter subunit A